MMNNGLESPFLNSYYYDSLLSLFKNSELLEYYVPSVTLSPVLSGGETLSYFYITHGQGARCGFMTS